MGIRGSLAADIGQLSNLQSLYVESLSQLISTLISLSALAVCHGEPLANRVGMQGPVIQQGPWRRAHTDHRKLEAAHHLVSS